MEKGKASEKEIIQFLNFLQVQKFNQVKSFSRRNFCQKFQTTKVL